MLLRYISLLVLILIISIIAISGCNNSEISPVAAPSQTTGTTTSSPAATLQITDTPTSPAAPTPTQTPSPDPSLIASITSYYIANLKKFATESDIIVQGTITDQKEEVVNVDYGGGPGTVTYLIFTLSVEKVIKGDPAIKEVFVKEYAGVVGEFYFSINDKVLVGLEEHPENMYSLYNVLWINGHLISSSDLSEVLGDLIVVMKANNIPVALPENEYPPLPAEINLSSKLSKLTQNELDQIEEYLKNPPGRQ